MKVVFTEQSIESLSNSLYFLRENADYSNQQLIKLRDALLNKAEALSNNPQLGQLEPYLEHLNLKHRRIIHEHYKIIYRIEGSVIYITDFFDSRQDVEKMRG